MELLLFLYQYYSSGHIVTPDSYGSRAYLDEDKTKRTRSRLHASRARARGTLISCFHLTSARRMALSRVAVGQPPP